MIERPIDTISKDDIEALVQGAVPESRTIEYKAQLPGASDHEKLEFLADTSSFANASGGDLLFGVDAEDGVPTKALGLRALNADADILRLESIIRDGLQPRLPGLRVRTIDGFPNGPVVLIRVPRSWIGPHVVTYKNWSRFFSRTSRGKQQLDVTELRTAFALSEALPERIKRFRDDRFAKIVADETPILLAAAPKAVLHVLPYDSFSSTLSLEPRRMREHLSSLPPLGRGGWNHRLNIDGLVTESGSVDDTGPHGAYCQVFRNGAIETVTAQMMGRGERKIIPSLAFEQEVMHSVRFYFEFLQKLGVPPPASVMAALIGVRGYALAVRDAWSHEPTPIDRDMLILPDVLIEDFNCDIPLTLRPLFDGLWNAGGFERSFNYDDEGSWKSR